MKIIVAVDGTEQSERAITALSGLKWDTGTEIKLVTVLKSDQYGLPFVSKKEHLAPELLAAANNALKDMVIELEKMLPGCSITFEVAQGDARAKITEAAKSWGANAIFMGSRGIKGIDAMFLGSVSEGVMLRSPCPVVIVKADAKKDAGSFKKILVAVDNSAFSAAAIKWMKSIHWSKEAQFKLITVVAPLIEAIESLQDAAAVADINLRHDKTLEDAKNELQVNATVLSGQIAAESITTQVAEGDPRDVILGAAENMKADLIIMGSHGRTGLDKLLIGSVSQAVAVQAECSVAIVRGLVPKGKDNMQMSGRFET